MFRRLLDLQHDAQPCTLFCAFFLMARLANIVPSSCNTIDPGRPLTRCDVASNELGLIVTFHCTVKTRVGT